MKKYVKDFCLRGLIFGGFGPIVAGIVYMCISYFEDVALGGADFFIIIISTYLLAFVHAGASIFNQIEHWSVAKSIGCHFSVLYIAYVICYLVNRWMPFDWRVIAVFTGIFVAVYLVIWFTIYVIVRGTARKLNSKIG